MLLLLINRVSRAVARTDMRAVGCLDGGSSRAAGCFSELTNEKQPRATQQRLSNLAQVAESTAWNPTKNRERA